MNQYRIKNLPKRIFLPSLVVCTVCFMFSSFSVLYAQTGTVWVNRTSAADIPWQSVTYGNGLFVAVSNIVQSPNQVMTSTNGINWEAHTAALPLQWNSVTYGNGTFVAVASSGSGNRVMTSTDGTSWTPRTSASDNLWTSVTYGNGVFVAVSVNDGSGNVMTSPDGITWTRRNAPRNNWQSVTYGKGLFVVVAESTSPAGSTAQGNRVMTSPDGITWTSRATPAENNWRSVTYGNGLFVAVASTGSGNRVMTSPDGITWTLINTPATAENPWRSVTYGNGLFVAVANTGAHRVMTSSDGINWTTGTASADNAWWSITYAHDIFVAVSIDGTGHRVMTSGTYADPLPVTLTSFNAKKQGEQALLSWFTAMEQDNKGFYVQRSERGNLFSNIGFVPARGNGTGAKYTFTDSFPLRGQNFYRLRQVDEDGTSSLSMVRVLDFSSILSNRLYPNPANDELFLNISTSINGTVSLRISDLQGRVLKSWRYNQVSPTLQIDISELHNGNYFLEIWNNDRGEVYPFVKQ